MHSGYKGAVSLGAVHLISYTETREICFSMIVAFKPSTRCDNLSILACNFSTCSQPLTLPFTSPIVVPLRVPSCSLKQHPPISPLRTQIFLHFSSVTQYHSPLKFDNLREQLLHLVSRCSEAYKLRPKLSSDTIFNGAANRISSLLTI